jgi:hypothetical protein
MILTSTLKKIVKKCGKLGKGILKYVVIYLTYAESEISRVSTLFAARPQGVRLIERKSFTKKIPLPLIRSVIENEHNLIVFYVKN